jgi:hypothetical protein
MSSTEQENVELRGEVDRLKLELEKLSIMMDVIMAEREQAVASEPIPNGVVSATAEGISQPIATAAASAGISQSLEVGCSSGDKYNEGFHPPGPERFTFNHLYDMPKGYPWGMPHMPNEGLRPEVNEIPFPYGQQIRRATVTQAGPTVHTTQQEEGQIYHSGSVLGNDRMGNLEEKLEGVQKELRNVRGKKMFNQNVHDLCLVPNVVIPYKFKAPAFEKYTGETCPQMHLTMYVRKMTAHKEDEPFLIYCFQDSLAGPAHTWYMNLKSVASFEELADAFLQQYKYNSFLAPNRKELQSMSQGHKESFKEYAQRFIQKSAQIRPSLDESELSDLFYETLSPFYSEKMLACAS